MSQGTWLRDVRERTGGEAARPALPAASSAAPPAEALPAAAAAATADALPAAAEPAMRGAEPPMRGPVVVALGDPRSADLQPPPAAATANAPAPANAPASSAAAADGPAGLRVTELAAFGVLLAALEARARDDADLRSALGVVGRWLQRLAASAESPGGAVTGAGNATAANNKPLATNRGPTASSADAAGTGPRSASSAQHHQPAAPAAPRTEKVLKLGESPIRLSVPDTGLRRAPGEPAPGWMGPVLAAPPPVGPGTTGATGAATAGATPWSASLPEPQMLVKRCQLKAAACRWAARRRTLLAAADADFDRDVRPTDEKLAAEARALGARDLWMTDPYGPKIPDDILLEKLAACYEAVAAGMALAADLAAEDPGAGPVDEAMKLAVNLLAEAQCMLRTGLWRVFDDLRDDDQNQAHAFLRDFCQRRSVYVQRFMRLNDEADPAGAAELRQRIDAARAERERKRSSARERHRQLGRARYHAGRLRDGSADPDHDLRTLLDAVEKLLAAGCPASDRDLREVLLPVVDKLPVNGDEMPGFLRPVMAELDRFIAESERAADARGAADDREATRPLSEEVLALRRALAGRRVVLIGGECRNHSKRKLEDAFGLEELVWITTVPHQSLADFEPAIRHPRTALVLLAIRWSSHSFGELKHIADLYGKPFVRLPAGYNPEQVARQVLDQCSEILKRADPAP